MHIYEINEELESLIDEETGELLDCEKFMDLNLERNTKIDNMAAWVINLNAEAEALKNQIDVLQKRKKTAENKAESLKSYLSYILAGATFKSPRVAVSYHTSESVAVDDDFLLKLPEEFLRKKDPEPDKVAIKKALKENIEVPGAHLDKKVSIVIK